MRGSGVVNLQIPLPGRQRRAGVFFREAAHQMRVSGRRSLHQAAVPSAVQHEMLLRRRGTFLIEGSAFTQGGPASSVGQWCCESAGLPFPDATGEVAKDGLTEMFLPVRLSEDVTAQR